MLLSVVVGLATRHAWREASGVPRPVKVERRRQKQIDPRRWRAFEVETLNGRGARYPEKKARTGKLFLTN